MSIKLVASDIDGTLVNNNKDLLPSTKQAVREFTDRGGVFVIATGRPISGIRRYIKELELDKRGGLLISYNGSFILDTVTEKPILRNFIDTETAKSVVEVANKYKLSIMTYRDGAAVTERARDEYFMLETRINLLDKVYVDSLYDYIDSPVPKFLITGEGDKLAKYEVILRSELENVNIFRSEPFFLEIVPKSVSKGASLEFVGKYLNIPKSEIMACGDGFNDISFLNASGLGVAMGNAQRPVLDCADFVTLSNEEDGLGYAIRKFCL